MAPRLYKYIWQETDSELIFVVCAITLIQTSRSIAAATVWFSKSAAETQTRLHTKHLFQLLCSSTIKRIIYHPAINQNEIIGLAVMERQSLKPPRQEQAVCPSQAHFLLVMLRLNLRQKACRTHPATLQARSTFSLCSRARINNHSLFITYRVVCVSRGFG